MQAIAAKKRKPMSDVPKSASSMRAESSHRWVKDISPLEITRIGVSEQLVAVESVARAGHEMHRGECEAEKP